MLTKKQADTCWVANNRFSLYPLVKFILVPFPGLGFTLLLFGEILNRGGRRL